MNKPEVHTRVEEKNDGYWLTVQVGPFKNWAEANKAAFAASFINFNPSDPSPPDLGINVSDGVGAGDKVG
jgi:hypothetical protein